MRYISHIMIGLGLGLLTVPAVLQQPLETGFDMITLDNAHDVREVYRIQSSNLANSPDETFQGQVYSTAYSSDSRWLATTGYGGVVKIWDVAVGELLHAWDIGTDDNYFVQAVFSPDDRWLIVTGRFEDIVALFDMKTGERVSLLDPTEDGVGTRYMKFSFDGAGHIAVGFVPALDSYLVLRIEIWDLNTGTLVYKLSGAEYLHYSPNGRYLMSGDILYDTITWQAVHDFKDSTLENTSRVRFSSNSGSFFRNAENRLGLWDIETEAWVWQIELFSPYFSYMVMPDEKTIFLTDEKQSQDWFSSIVDAKTGETVTVWDENTGVTIEDFSPNGQLMVLSVKDSIELWDVRDLADKKRLATIYKGMQPAAFFSPDGRTIIVEDNYDLERSGELVILAVQP